MYWSRRIISSNWFETNQPMSAYYYDIYNDMSVQFGVMFNDESGRMFTGSYLSNLSPQQALIDHQLGYYIILPGDLKVVTSGRGNVLMQSDSHEVALIFISLL